MNKLLTIFILSLLLAGCLAFGPSGVRLSGPIFGQAEKGEKEQRARFIKWRSIQYNELFSFKTKKCAMFYYRTQNCAQCDVLEDTIFADDDLIEKINDGFIPFMITNDNPDFKKLLTVFNPKDVPAVGFGVGRQKQLWDNGNEKELYFLIDKLYHEKCKPRQ